MRLWSTGKAGRAGFIMSNLGYYDRSSFGPVQLRRDYLKGPGRFKIMCKARIIGRRKMDSYFSNREYTVEIVWLDPSSGRTVRQAIVLNLPEDVGIPFLKNELYI